MNFKTKLWDGTLVYDSVVDKGETAKFDIMSIPLAGFQDIVQMMVKGDRWEVYVPWTLAYGYRVRRMCVAGRKFSRGITGRSRRGRGAHHVYDPRH